MKRGWSRSSVTTCCAHVSAEGLPTEVIKHDRRGTSIQDRSPESRAIFVTGDRVDRPFG